MSTQAIPTDHVTQTLRKIEAMISSGQYPAAAEALQQVQNASPGDARVYLLLSRLAEANGSPKAALEAMRHAISALPGWPVAAIEMALLLSRQSQFPDAIQQAERALQLAPGQLDYVTRAVDIAHRAQNIPQALQWLHLATALAPTNRLFKQLIATDLGTLGQHAESLAAFTALVESDPADQAALFGRVQAAIANGDMKLAKLDAAALVALDPENEEYKFWQDIAKGKTPKTQPAAVVRKVFAGFADLYDQHMVRGLRYQLPKQVAKIITDRYAAEPFNVLDLGCGTGLLGVCLGRINGALIGVDLSEEMIAQAMRHNVYDRFHHVNLLDALKATPKSLYHVVAACDVFNYVGDLSKAISGAYKVLVPGGSVIFSIEAAGEDEADVVLRSTMRYVHKPSHVEALCQKSGFEDITLTPTVIRLENNAPVNGFLVVARKPA